MAVTPYNSTYGRFNALGSQESFPDPFLDIATLSMPDNFRNTLYWCEYIYTMFGTYRMAMERIISYFLTNVEITGDDVSDDEKDKYGDFLTETIDAITVLQSLMRDRMCYGNSFASVIVPFKRYLMSPGGDLFPLREVYKNPNFKFEFSEYKFIATCPRTKKRGPWKVIDKPDDEEKKIRVKRWNPHEIEILHDPYTDEVAYLWRIPEDYKKLVRDGNLFHLERVSEQVLKCIRLNKMFRFNPDVIHHMKEPTLSGIRIRGWGLPRILSNFRQIWYVQVLRRYNEAIALDYVIPFRLITPMPRPGASQAGGLQGGDMLQMFHGGDFKSQINSMIRRRRRDPASWQVLPFPVQYQMLGGDANQLAPTDLLDQGMESLLNEAGTPVELYKGSLQLQAAPVALRLFESTWHHLVHDANHFLQWLVDQTSQIMSWEVVEASLKKVQIADDMQKQMAALQLMMGQQVSGTTGLKAIGYDWDTEQKLLAEEARRQQEIQARMQEEMEQAGFAQEIARGQGGGAPGGDPAAGGAAGPGQNAAPQGTTNAPGPDAMSALGGGTPVTTYIQSMGPNVPITPEDMMATADQLASELLGLPEGVKDSELRKLKQYNEALHSMVRARMDSKRQDMKNQGGAMMQQQMAGGGMAGGAPPMM